jgi:hypothetical protein
MARVEDAPGFLEARWWTDGDGTGKLTITAASSSGFAGHSWAWFNATVVMDFAQKLERTRYTPTICRPSLVARNRSEANFTCRSV